jgi:hypothetical protein
MIRKEWQQINTYTLEWLDLCAAALGAIEEKYGGQSALTRCRFELTGKSMVVTMEYPKDEAPRDRE